ncbi:response regulator transcription factor [Sandarakinorhabdus oryzae]|uniref:response regulator transcription factor n=1 Tax=Sandarakinorhabdus oryzae TaxID=2675220 RepID=UPI0012E31DA8|nr:response regulator transcription factor [Sandarakinorhabdus oryzae]
MRVLLVQDSIETAERLSLGLTRAGFVVEHAANGEAALAGRETAQFAALVVDLPGLTGIDFVARWRAAGHDTPILILNASAKLQDKVAGLNAGGDDYVVKPVHLTEIVARLHALVRRSFNRAEARLALGALELDPAGKAAWLHGQPVALTQTEFKLLHQFLLRPQLVLSKAEILDNLYPSPEDRDPNTVEVHIGRLRRKIGRSAIRTVRGLGYRLQL